METATGLATPLHVLLWDPLQRAHRSLDALAAWSRRDAPERPQLEAALAGSLDEIARIQHMVARVFAPPPRAKSYLVADDSPDMRLLVTRLIRRASPDATIRAVKDVAEAIEALRDAGDGEGVVVITDFDMGPGPTGIELLSEIAQRHPKARRVLFTGHSRERLPIGTSGLHLVLDKAEGFEPLRRLLDTA